MRLPAFELPEAVLAAQTELDKEVASALDAMADQLDGKPAGPHSGSLQEKLEDVERAVKDAGEASSQLDGFLMLARKQAELTAVLGAEI